MSYAWAPGAPFSGDADEIQIEIERIRATGREITPASVVAAARLKSSPLHRLIFNVDKSLAAERYYLNRAAAMLASIRVVTEEGETTHVRPYVRVSVGETESPVYRSINEEAARMQRTAWLRSRLINIKAELKDLNLFPIVVSAIEDELAA